MNLLLIFIALLVSVSTVSADVYKYTAPDGNVYYTDEPSHKKYKLIIRSKPKGYVAAFKHLQKNKQKYTPIIAAAAEKHGLDPKLVHAVIHAESAYDAKAISSAGAVGLMQLMPATALQYGATNRKDPEQNIFAGTRYLKYLLSLFDDNLKLSIAAYNAGENAVKKYHNQIPPYPETQKYVKQVLSLYQKSDG
ncbi:MAG: lytic transglycosylase domain-containing protein [Methyloprofundus sp.]|nr:lytic transglycosylase domain-containing protein [Methyloprofundus sp.]MBW6452543.1 lytic transglycosylase domain-containing protein [Methyloprofundus sp.]